MLILPVMVASCVFSFYPLLKTIISSFTFTNVYGEWTGWAGGFFWKRMFGNEEFWKMLGITLKFAAANFAGTFVMAMFMALISYKKSKNGRMIQMLFASRQWFRSAWNLRFTNCFSRISLPRLWAPAQQTVGS